MAFNRPFMKDFYVCTKVLKSLRNVLPMPPKAQKAATVGRLIGYARVGMPRSASTVSAVMHQFQGEQDQRKPITPSRKLWTVLHALDGYLSGQGDWLVNYAERHQAGLRAG